ncbi:hypothetical protein ABEV54_18315 [Peribacillus psychrosaccharolyticus]|uniref:hypothetical protein n=1 Tax=Peribacillus psychrosaccharolyticus TaxID=1407 RepID=UPI003D2D332A
MRTKDLKTKFYTNTNQELIKFLGSELTPNSSKDIRTVKNNIEALNRLDRNTLEYGIARMKTIEELNEFSKYLAPTVVLVLAIIAAYSNLFNLILINLGKYAVLLFPFILTVGMFIFITRLIGTNQVNKSSAIFVRSILENALNKEKK